jgi:signal peptidase II
LRTTTRLLLVSTLLIGCVGCDQVTKGAARAYLVPGGAQSFLHDTFRLIYAENSGAFLSLGADLSDQIKSGIFVIGVGLLSAGALAAAFLSRNSSRWQIIGLSLIGSGGIGNWIDRLVNDGRVTDFLNVGIGGVRTGIFNVADTVLMAGAALYFLASSRHAASNKVPERSGGN